MNLNRKKIYRDLIEYRVTILFLAVFTIFTVLSRPFSTINNIRQVLVNDSPKTIIVCGQAMVILGGGIDLSVGSLMALCGAVTAKLVVENALNPVLIILTVLVIGALAGLVNGVSVVKGKINPFIVTLGTLSIFRGLALIVTGGRSIQSANAPWFLLIGQGVLFDVPVPILIVLVGIVMTIVLTRKTTFGRGLYALGGNYKAARLSGIRVNRITIITYVLTGVSVAIAGIIQASMLASFSPILGQGVELETILGAVIGGISLLGGRGHIFGAVFGSIFISFVRNGLLLLRIHYYLEIIIIGTIFIAAVALDRFIQQQTQS